MPVHETLGRAKLNLYLDVLGRRDDGFHDLETLFLAVNWGDDVRVTVADAPPGSDTIDLVVRGDARVPTDASNLAVRAARAALEGAVSATRVAIEIDKRIPVGGGLGGGSADAAAVLRSLAPDRAADLGARLGSDVPFAVLGGAAVGTGRGERLAPLADVDAAFDIVLILPPVACDTATVFAGSSERVRPAPPNGLAAAVAALRSGDPAAIRAAHYNALAFSALRHYPVLRHHAVEVERRLGRAPMLSGSGSTLYDVPDDGDADRIVALLDGMPGTRVVVRP